MIELKKPKTTYDGFWAPVSQLVSASHLENKYSNENAFD